ncbi:hypothetical protein [Fibrobacter sp.]|uniref:hypothetical protein n=1 Tax=Fibrobacter sp. TaxID=35828 RepID=UPI0025BE521B|nr:hypothetical protein [Fibrobacter sp.]MCI6436641.1 hypothetical protein [Fibrobacter sp.]
MKQIQLQVAFFLSRFIERPDTLFYNKLSNEYNPPVILPPQNPLPGLLFIDSPVVQAVSKNGLINLTISNMRLDVTIKNLSVNVENDIIRRYYDISKDYSIIRVGFVSQFVERSEDSSQIFKKYLKIDDGVSEVSFRYNRKTCLNGININDVMNIQDAEFEENGNKQRGVLFVRDINSDPASKKEMDVEKILGLYRYSSKQFNEMCCGEN